MTTAALVGCTGQVGSHILSTLLALDTVKAVHTISRRTPKPESSSGSSRKLSAHVEGDTSKWASTLTAISPPPDVVFSALGTTREQSGGIANQWKIDHDLNIELAKSAHAGGIRSFVFVSCASTQGPLARLMPYLQMKQGVENAIRSLDFERAAVLRPGIILGDREREHQGGPFLKSLIRGIGGLSQAWHDNLGQDPEVIGRAAVKAALFAEADNGTPSRYRVIERQDIVRLGRDEWKF
ncbi:hypothetical protein PG985_002480 [Apiospora marii]|uniref:NAD-dependent epimerase/dehydratase domain-containing protein n=1 Tax=Apiospora marii TaxID=335849 RepID=A0ABR1RUM0_9PEZI